MSEWWNISGNPSHVTITGTTLGKGKELDN